MEKGEGSKKQKEMRKNANEKNIENSLPTSTNDDKHDF